MGIFGTGNQQPIELDSSQAKAVYDVLHAVVEWRQRRSSGTLARLKVARRDNKDVLVSLEKRISKLKGDDRIAGLSSIEMLAVWEACSNWSYGQKTWDDSGDGSGYYDGQAPKLYEAMVAMERVGHRVGMPKTCTACGKALVPAHASPYFDYKSLNDLAHLLLAGVCASCASDQRNAEEQRKDDLRKVKSNTDVALLEEYRASTSTAANLVSMEMQIMCDLLDIFADSTLDAHYWESYIEWWYENQCLVPDIVRRLKTLTSIDTLSRGQADQLCKVLTPVSLLEGADQRPLLQEEIRSTMRIGYDVHLWHIGDMNGSMKVAVRGTIYGEFLLGSCREALHGALGKVADG